ncbi:MAG: hypothetical protein JSS45_13970 [Proteobacteria bacterium]|nr:hypothetical protein [Pseudomonadota bacterium]
MDPPTPYSPAGVFDRVIGDGGGDNNASTHPDFTSHVERAPVSALAPLLWLEADRMKTLAFDRASLDNQRDVVKEEIRVNVLNQPCGGFATTDLPQLAFSNGVERVLGVHIDDAMSGVRHGSSLRCVSAHVLTKDVVDPCLVALAGGTKEGEHVGVDPQ